MGSRRVVIRPGWFDAGKRGQWLAEVEDVHGGVWTVVHWDGEEDPDLHKTRGLHWLAPSDRQGDMES